MTKDTAPKSVKTDDAQLTRFSDVDHWVFDLDNTLYPAKTDLFSQINAKISEYVITRFGMDEETATLKRRAYYLQYGTTLNGLMAEHQVDTADYLAHVHDIDYSAVPHSPDLDAAIKALPGKKYIFTNGDVPHAERTLKALGIGSHFEDIFDIVAADLTPKPHPDAYSMFLAQTGVKAEKAAMFEDLCRNLVVPKDLKMRTVHVVPEAGTHVADPETECSVDFVTDDLTRFLQSVLRTID